MILVGQYDSPFVRRVGISLHVLGKDFERDTRSVFADFDAMLQINPAGRIPSLILDDGTVIIDSAAILDWLDHEVGPDRALIPPGGVDRLRALKLIALATGAIEKAGAACYERVMRPEPYRWPEWIARCRRQASGAIAALAETGWPEKLDQAQITVACMVRHIRLVDPELMPNGHYAALDELSERLEQRPEFRRTYPDSYSIPQEN
jgi:glutathione S-transferase